MHCLSCAEKEELTPFEQAVLKGQNKHMQLLKVMASTLHRGVELLSTQAHTGLTEVTPLLQQAVAAMSCPTAQDCCKQRSGPVEHS